MSLLSIAAATATAMGNATSGGGGGNPALAFGVEAEVELACTERLSEVEWTRAAILSSFVVLGVINVMVIAGNTLVIAAVFLSSKLRTVTNLFIVSLAVSDLLVGIAVLPFSTSYQVLGVWIFGDIWCQMWLAVDVWMCTASILNLCAISLDRYVAVTRPVSYPSIMSSRRAKILIAIVWSLSFVICLPPLVGWNDTSTPAAIVSGNNHVHSGSNSSTSASPNVLNNYDGGEVAGGAAARSILSYRSDNEIFESLDVNYGDYDSGLSAISNRNNAFSNFSDQQTNILGALGKLMEEALSIRSELEEDVDRSSEALTSEWASVSLSNSSESNDSESAVNSSERTSSTTTSGGRSSGGSADHGTSGSGSYGRANMNATATACTCLLTSDKGYRIYAALGSFYLPMLVMMFFYWKIYRAAVETTRAINQGFRTTKSGGLGGRFDEQRLTLRIHRGRSSTDLYGKSNGSCSSESAQGSFRSGSHNHHHHHRRVRNSSFRDKWSAATGGRSNPRCISGMTFPPSSDSPAGGPRKMRSLQATKKKAANGGSDGLVTSPSGGANHADGTGNAATATSSNYSRRKAITRKNHWTSVQCKTTAGGTTTLPVTSTYAAVTTATSDSTPLPPPPTPCSGNSDRSVERFEFIPPCEQSQRRDMTCDAVTVDSSAPAPKQLKVQKQKSPTLREELQLQQQQQQNTGDGGDDRRSGPQIFAKMGKRNIKAQVKRFRTETKAAKTLGIIVGGFILCWLPFFTIYLVGAFCAEDCIPESLFAVFFWLGYCNSAINPCVYALFSRDFRHAFKRILCRCFMKREHSVKERLATMLPASLQLASFFEESEDGSNSH